MLLDPGEHLGQEGMGGIDIAADHVPARRQNKLVLHACGCCTPATILRRGGRTGILLTGERREGKDQRADDHMAETPHRLFLTLSVSG